MSRVANITAAFIGDISDAEAKYNALVSQAAKGIPVNFTGGGGAGATPTSTLGGQSVPSSASMAGASSPNFSFIGSQIAQQIAASLAPALQQLTTTIPTSSPNWSNYFGGIQNQLAAMTPTSSPNMGVIMQQAMQNAMYPVGSSSPNWGYYANIAAGNRGGGARTPANQGLMGGGAFRLAGAAMFATHGLNALATEFTHAQSIDEMMGRGDIDEALQTQLSAAQGRRQGLGGVLRSAYHAYSGDPGYDDEADENAARQGIAIRRFDRTMTGAQARTRQFGYRTRAVGMGEVDRTALEGQASLDTLTQEQIPQREQVASLRNNNLPDQANQLERTLNAQMEAARKLADAQNKEAERLRGITVGSLDAGGRTGLMAANGYTVLAERQSIIDRESAEIAREKDPVLRAAMQARMSADVSAFDIGTRRQFAFQAEDAEGNAAVSQLRANRDTYGAERREVENRRRSAMRALPQNWFTDMLGMGALRDSLNKQFDAEQGEIGARQDFENGTIQRGVSGRNASLQFMLDKQPLAARLNAIDTERDRTIRNLRPDQEYLEGGIRTGARRERALAIRDEAEARANIEFSAAGASTQIRQLLNRNPLGAEITGIQTDAATHAAQLRNQGRTDAANAVLAVAAGQVALARQQDRDRQDAIGLSLTTQSVQLSRLAANNPAGAEAAGIVGGTIAQATALRNQGMGGLALQALGVGNQRLDLAARQYVRGFEASGIDSRFNNDVGNGGPGPGEVLGQFAQGRMQLLGAGIGGAIQKAGQFIQNINPFGGAGGSAADASDNKGVVDKLEEQTKRIEAALKDLVSD